MNNNNKKQTNFKSDSFFEAFRELGSDVQKTSKDAAKSIGSDMWNQISPFGTNKPSFSGELMQNEALDFDLEVKRREEQAAKKERRHGEMQRRKEEMVFNRKEKELKEQIEYIQNELVKQLEMLADETGGMVGELQVAVEQNVVSPGQYHVNFFDKIRQLFILLRKKITESRTWMHTVNSRSQQKSYFWGQVGKSGSKFMLSQERTTATQAG